LYGVTVDDIDGLSAITQSLAGRPKVPTSRAREPRVIVEVFRQTGGAPS
jgi:hypothetical protein